MLIYIPTRTEEFDMARMEHTLTFRLSAYEKDGDDLKRQRGDDITIVKKLDDRGISQAKFDIIAETWESMASSIGIALNTLTPTTKAKPYEALHPTGPQDVGKRVWFVGGTEGIIAAMGKRIPGAKLEWDVQIATYGLGMAGMMKFLGEDLWLHEEDVPLVSPNATYIAYHEEKKLGTVPSTPVQSTIKKLRKEEDRMSDFFKGKDTW